MSAASIVPQQIDVLGIPLKEILSLSIEDSIQKMK